MTMVGFARVGLARGGGLTMGGVTAGGGGGGGGGAETGRVAVRIFWSAPILQVKLLTKSRGNGIRRLIYKGRTYQQQWRQELARPWSP